MQEVADRVRLRGAGPPDESDAWRLVVHAYDDGTVLNSTQAGRRPPTSDLPPPTSDLRLAQQLQRRRRRLLLPIQ
jgi:hypothetical protein